MFAFWMKLFVRFKMTDRLTARATDWLRSL